MRLTHPLAGREARKTKQNQGSRVDSAPRWLREEPDQEACLKKEAERRGQPLVIDKTKEYKQVSTQYIKVPSLGQVMHTDQRTDHLTNLRSKYRSPVLP